jgi:hypothetical protein
LLSAIWSRPDLAETTFLTHFEVGDLQTYFIESTLTSSSCRV